MRSSLHCLFLLLCFSSLAQFVEIKDLIEPPPDQFGNATFHIMAGFKMYDEQRGFVVSSRGNGSPSDPAIIYVFNTFDGWLTYDSTMVFGHIIRSGSVICTPSGHYFFSTKSTNSDSTTAYGHYTYHSSDFGATWSAGLIDSNVVTWQFRNLVFLNDSVGIYFTGIKVYRTLDYGANWEEAFLLNGNDSRTRGHNGTHFLFDYGPWYLAYNPFTGIVDTVPQQSCVCTGNQMEFYNNVLYKNYLAYDGQALGYNSGNYDGLVIDEMPLGNERIIHFPEIANSTDLAITDDSIFLLIGNSILASDLSGDTWSLMPDLALDPGGNWRLPVIHIEYINSQVAYAITRSFAGDFRLWKTTNGSGIGAPIVTHTFYAGMDENAKVSAFLLYPNPGQNILQLRFEQAGQRQIELLDLQGHVLLQENSIDYQVQLHTENLASGTYLMRVWESGVANSQIWVKE